MEGRGAWREGSAVEAQARDAGRRVRRRVRRRVSSVTELEPLQASQGAESRRRDARYDSAGQISSRLGGGSWAEGIVGDVAFLLPPHGGLNAVHASEPVLNSAHLLPRARRTRSDMEDESHPRTLRPRGHFRCWHLTTPQSDAAALDTSHVTARRSSSLRYTRVR